MRKPEIGIKPRFILDEERVVEIREAMIRFTNNHQAIPLDWIEEYNELVGRINEREKIHMNMSGLKVNLGTDEHKEKIKSEAQLKPTVRTITDCSGIHCGGIVTNEMIEAVQNAPRIRYT